MSCDIHFKLEAKRKSLYAYDDKWHADFMFGGNWGCQGLPANYDIFSALAGVRSSGEFPCMFVPRGIPEDIDDYTKEAFVYRVNDKLAEASEEIASSEKYIFEETAKDWMSRGITEECKIYYETGYIDPDSHTFSWLTCDEFCKVIDYCKSSNVIAAEYVGLCAYMKALKEQQYIEDVRIIFWFDN